MQGNWYGVWVGGWFGDGADEEPGAMSGSASFTITATGALSSATQEQGGGAATSRFRRAAARIARLDQLAEPEKQPQVVRPPRIDPEAGDLAQGAIARAMESARQEDARIAAVLGQIEAESKAAQAAKAAAATAEIAAMLDAIEAEQERSRRQNNRNRAAILAALMLLD